MRTISVLQNTDSEHLGLIEDHLEGRNIRFRYIRPAHDPNWLRSFNLPSDGLILLGAAPYGTLSEPLVPMLDQKVSAIRSYLESNNPILALSTGTQLLALAADYSVKPTELIFRIDNASRIDESALNRFIPESYPIVTYMRDFPDLPSDAQILAVAQDNTPALFQIAENCLGFIGHPGIKSAMVEDSILQYGASIANSAETLRKMQELQPELTSSLIKMMTGTIQFTGWM